MLKFNHKHLISLILSLSYFLTCHASTSLNTRIEEIEEKIKRLNKEIHQQQNQSNKNSIQNKKSIFELDYLRYLPKDDNSQFIWHSDDAKNELLMAGIIQFNQDVFPNAEGLLFNNGIESQPALNKNTMTRYWLNRASLVFETNIHNAIHWIFIPDFGRNQVRLFDGLVDVNYYRLLGFQTGYQKSLVAGIGTLQPATSLYGYTGFSSLMAPNRELGAIIHGSLGPYHATQYAYGTYLGFNDWLSYQVGVFNGAADGENPGLNPVSGRSTVGNTAYISQPLTLNNKAFEARFFWNPFIANENSILQHLGIGFASSVQTANNQGYIPSILSIGQNPIFAYENIIANGNRTRLHPELIYYIGIFGVLADWTQTLQHLTPGPIVYGNNADNQTNQIRQLNKATDIQFILNLTGEDFSFSEFKPNRPFHMMDKKSLGGWQLGLRLTSLHMDPSVFADYKEQDFGNGDGLRLYTYSNPKVSVQKANAWTVSLMWYWNQNFSISYEFTQTQFTGGCSTGAFQDPNTPGCLTADIFYINNTSSQVINRPTEKLFIQRFQLLF